MSLHKRSPFLNVVLSNGITDVDPVPTCGNPLSTEQGSIDQFYLSNNIRLSILGSLRPRRRSGLTVFGRSLVLVVDRTLTYMYVQQNATRVSYQTHKLDPSISARSCRAPRLKPPGTIVVVVVMRPRWPRSFYNS